MLPFLIYITWSAISLIAALCVTIIIVFFSFLQKSCNNFKIFLPVFESNAPVGSSHNRSSGFLAIALAIDTLCCSPPDNWDGKLLALSSKPTLLITLKGSKWLLQTSPI